MGSYQDLENVLRHINDVAHNQDAWKQGLSQQQQRDINGWRESFKTGKDYTDPETGAHYYFREVNHGRYPQVPDDALDRLRSSHPGYFDANSKAPTLPPGAPAANTPAGGSSANPAPSVATDEQNRGKAAEAAKELESKLQSRNDMSVEADRKLAQAVLNAHATSADAAKKLNGIQAEIEAAVKAQTALDTPLGAREFRRFLVGKIKDISDVVQNAQLDAQSQKDVLAALSEFYRTRPEGDQQGGGTTTQNGGQGGGEGGAGGAGGGTGDLGGDLGGGLGDLGDLGADLGLGGTTPDAAGQLGQLASGAAQQIPAAIGGIPGALGGAAGGLGGIPSSLGSLLGGGAGGGGEGLKDMLKGSSKDKSGLDEGGLPSMLDDPSLNMLDGGESGKDGDHGDDKDHGDGKDKHNNDNPAEPKPGAAAPNLLGTTLTPNTTGPVTVTLKDGAGGTMPVTAPNRQVANVLEAIDKGTPAAEAYRQNNIILPPPGTAPTTVVDPHDLNVGDPGSYTDGRISVYVGQQKAYVDGHIQPISSAGGTGFLGWQHLPQQAAAPATPTPAAQGQPAPAANPLSQTLPSPTNR